MRAIRHSAAVSMHHEASSILDVLLDASRVADWNPALSSVEAPHGPAPLGRGLPTRIRGVVRGTLTFLEAPSLEVRHRLDVPGGVEHGSWLLEPLASGATRVTHTMDHTGPVLRLMRRAFEPVPLWRLERLDRTVGERSRSR